VIDAGDLSNQPVVSILINNYNYGRFLGEAIDSALKQTYSKTEVIVVDDGSTDNSRDVIAKYGDRIITDLKSNGGQASAFNAGFKACTGDIICILDSDDAFIPEKVSEIVEIFTSDSEIGWCYHTLNIFDASLGKFLRSDPEGLPSRKIDFRSSIQTGKLPSFAPATSGLCFKRSVIEKILPMPEAITHISDYYVKWTALSLSPGFFLSKDLAIQKVHGGNMFTLRSDNQRLDARILILTGYWIRVNFPSLKKFADKLFGIGLGLYWRTGGVEAQYQKDVDQYFSLISPLKKVEIYLRASYHANQIFSVVRDFRLALFKKVTKQGVD